jgi:hypothetical protein
MSYGLTVPQRNAVRELPGALRAVREHPDEFAIHVGGLYRQIRFCLGLGAPPSAIRSALQLT